MRKHLQKRGKRGLKAADGKSLADYPAQTMVEAGGLPRWAALGRIISGSYH